MGESNLVHFLVGPCPHETFHLMGVIQCACLAHFFENEHFLLVLSLQAVAAECFILLA